MRNLKRVLSLALASVMVLGMVVTASAAPAVGAVKQVSKDDVSWLKNAKEGDFFEVQGKDDSIYVLKKASGFKLIADDIVKALQSTVGVEKTEATPVAATSGVTKGTVAFTTSDDGNVLDVRLGTPIVGAKLPGEIVIDNDVTVKVIWKDEDGNDVTGQPAGKDVKYTYELTVTKTTGKAATEAVTMYTEDQTTGEPEAYIVPKGELDGAKVDEKGDATGENNESFETTTPPEEPEEPEEPEIYAVTVSADTHSTAAIRDPKDEGYTPEDTVVVEITVADGYTLKAVTVNDQAVPGSELVWNDKIEGWTYSITNITENKAVKVTSTPAPADIKLTLAGELFKPVTAEGARDGMTISTVTVWSEDVNSRQMKKLTGTESRSNNEDVMVYEIPTGSAVEVVVAGSDLAVADGSYKVGNTYVDAKVSGGTSATLSFTMSETLTLKMDANGQILDKSGSASESFVKVTTHNGVTANLTRLYKPSADGEAAPVAILEADQETIKVGANSTERLAPGFYKVEITGFGEGKYAYVTGWNGFLFTSEEKTYTPTGALTDKEIRADFDIYAGYKVTSGMGVTRVCSTWDQDGDFYPVDTKITLHASTDVKQFIKYPNLDEKDVVVASSDPRVFTGRTYTVNKADGDTRLWAAVNFTLGAGVKATPGGEDKADSVEAIGSATEKTTWTMRAVVVDAGEATEKVLGTGWLWFEAADKTNSAVVEPHLVKLGLDNSGSVTGSGGNEGKGGHNMKTATAFHIEASQVFEGAEWAAWTKVAVADNVQDCEGYYVVGNVKETIFLDVQSVAKLEGKAVDKAGMGGLGYERFVGSLAKTIYVDPSFERDILILVLKDGTKALSITGCEWTPVETKDSQWPANDNNWYANITVGSTLVTIGLAAS